MGTYTLLIHGSPVRAGQKIYLIANENIVREIFTGKENLLPNVISLLGSYTVTKIQLAGAKSYMRKIEQEILSTEITKHLNHSITFEYI
jgi:replication initiation and membrane attachment protein DnaB